MIKYIFENVLILPPPLQPAMSEDHRNDLLDELFI